MAQVRLGGLLHLGQDHGGDLLGRKGLLTDIGGDDNVGLAVLLDHLEGHVLAVLLHGLVRPLAANETLGIEDGVLGVGGQLVLGGITDKALAILGESDVRGRDTVTCVSEKDIETPCSKYKWLACESGKQRRKNRRKAAYNKMQEKSAKSKSS